MGNVKVADRAMLCYYVDGFVSGLEDAHVHVASLTCDRLLAQARWALKNFRNVDCVAATQNKVQDTQANLITTLLLFAV